jgi:hypothetical protein
VLWATQDGKVKVAQQTGAGSYKLIGELTAKSFDDTGKRGADRPTAHLAALVKAARAFANVPKNATPERLAQLQAAVAASEAKVVGDILANACKALNAGCFAAGTKLRTREGFKGVEQIEPGDWLLSRDEYDPAGELTFKQVEARFERTGQILHLHAGGEVIRTTPEHPFFVYDKGWTAAGALGAGDVIRTDAGWVAVEEVFDTGLFETVYNCRVADFHTYFVACAEWDFSVWAHNTSCDFRTAVNDMVPAGKQLTAKGADMMWGNLNKLSSEEEIRGQLQQWVGRSKLGRILRPEEENTLYQAAVKGNRRFDEAARQLEQSVGSSAEARSQIERTFEHSSDSGRLVPVKKTGNTVYLEGQVQKGTSAGHKARMVLVAAHQLEEQGTVAVFVDRPLIDALKWLETQPGISATQRAALELARAGLRVPIPADASRDKDELRKYPVKEPDVVRIRNVNMGTNLPPAYMIDITEVYSPPRQTEGGLLDRIQKAFDLIPSSMQGRKSAPPPVNQ